MNTSSTSALHTVLDLTKRATAAAVRTTKLHVIPAIVTHSRHLAKASRHFATVTLPPHLERAALASQSASREVIRFSQDQMLPTLRQAGHATHRWSQSPTLRMSALALIAGGGIALVWNGQPPASAPAPGAMVATHTATATLSEPTPSSKPALSTIPAVLKTSAPARKKEARPSMPPAVAQWKRVEVKGYSVPVPDGWNAASSKELRAYNEYLAECIRMQGGQHFDMDGRIVQNGSPLGGLLGVNICVVPRAIFEPELASVSSAQEQIVREVDDLQPWLHHLKSEGSYYDAKNDLLFSQTTSIGANGQRMAYNGIVLFRDGLQVEIHGNCLINDKDNMAALVSLIASGVRKAD